MPPDLLGRAKNRAKAKSRSFSNYVAHLIKQDLDSEHANQPTRRRNSQRSSQLA